MIVPGSGWVRSRVLDVAGRGGVRLVFRAPRERHPRPQRRRQVHAEGQQGGVQVPYTLRFEYITDRQFSVMFRMAYNNFHLPP